MRLNVSATEKDKQMNARVWLSQNDYPDIARKVDRALNRMGKKDSGTRRSWWEILAGTKAGKPRKVEGVVFPVLRAARLREGWDVTPNCLCRNENEIFPPKLEQKRWTNRSK
jgi:hypothetical protein